MKKNIFLIAAVLLISSVAFSACNKDEEGTDNSNSTREAEELAIPCSFENPLTDLPWLKEMIEEFESYEKMPETLPGSIENIRIYQCTYKGGIGFLLSECEGCPDGASWLLNCEGEKLCMMGGIAGFTCPEFEIDPESEKLIWRINMDPTNPCDFGDPLIDLLWLKKRVNEITSQAQAASLSITTYIYQCTYGDGKTGFIEDQGNIAIVYNCEGETLCILGGSVGETCPELKIDHTSKVPILKIMI
jgi:hypothetical protein